VRIGLLIGFALGVISALAYDLAITVSEYQNGHFYE
jgi:predicted outer membrane lipoprotein